MADKLWHDDIRREPDDTWDWCRTNEAAMEWLSDRALEEMPYLECSLDHDLGLHNLDPSMFENPDILRGEAVDNGVDLVRWMIAYRRVPSKLTIHSWNPDGARTMATLLNDAGHNVVISPFKLRR